jgi:hypothetical protein
MKINRIYSDEDGESHMEEIEVSFELADFAPPAPPLHISKFMPANRYGFIKISKGWVGDWHPAPKRQLMVYISGEVEGEVSDGTTRRMRPGSVCLLEDTTGKGHNSRVVGNSDVILAVVQLED